MKQTAILLLVPLLYSCSVSKHYHPDRKYSPDALRQDYTLLRTVLEKKHPSLYWYTPRDSMNRIFDEGYQAIRDSMTELQFGWKIIAPTTSAIHCGHTSFSMSKGWNKFIRNRVIPSFPLFLKIWSDTMVVMYDLNRHDSLLHKGDLVTSINGLKSADIIRIMFDYMVEDGYSDNVNYIRLSESFPYFYRNIFGIYPTYHLEFIDSSGTPRTADIPYYNPSADSINRKMEQRRRLGRLSAYERKQNIRSLQFDSSFALMTINSFSRGHLRHFFRKSFRDIRKRHLANLVIDIRANGGGDINNYVLLTRFLRRTPFRVADSAYSIARNFGGFTRYISSGFLNNLGLAFLTHREQDGHYHFGFWERHVFRPKKRHFFGGKTYVLVNGLTFSASSLFCNAVKGQPGILLVGEETGGGWYGNSGIIIPDIILPHTHLRVRLPFFRIVQYHHIAERGTGVMPDLYIGPVYRDVVNGVDTKMERVIGMIRAGQ